MITRERVNDIVHARLADQELIDALKQVSTGDISRDVLRLFIEEIRATAVGANELPKGAGLLDVSGTGGSGMAHFNTSTFCAFVLAAGGAKVAKFGNRASRSGAGSADLLEALGFPLDLPPSRVADVIDRAGVAFLFAPHYYPGLKRLAAARRAVGQPTVFNHIGPLLNPVNPQYRLLGISSEHVYPLIVRHLAEGNSPHTFRALVVRSQIGIDELVPGLMNAVSCVRDGEVQDLSFTAGGAPLFGCDELRPAHLDLGHNLKVFNDLLTISRREQCDIRPWLDLVSLNAGAGFFVTGAAATIEDGVKMAEDFILSGKVKEKFDEVRRVYEKCAA